MGPGSLPPKGALWNGARRMPSTRDVEKKMLSPLSSTSYHFPVLNRAQIVDRDNLSLALHDRRRGAPLITVANHHSCMDEPLLWGKLISSYNA